MRKEKAGRILEKFEKILIYVQNVSLQHVLAAKRLEINTQIVNFNFFCNNRFLANSRSNLRKRRLPMRMEMMKAVKKLKKFETFKIVNIVAQNAKIVQISLYFYKI